MSKTINTDKTVNSDITNGIEHVWKRRVITILHLMVLAASAIMVVWVSKESLENISFLTDGAYMHFQLWVCILFIFDIVVEFVLTPRKRKIGYLLTHLMFLIVSIPWLNILFWLDIKVPGHIYYLLRLVPLIRAGYVLAIVSGALTSRKSLSMLWVYITWVTVAVYFAGLMFFVEEHGVNPDVDTFWTALWWAFLDMTTCGTNINPITDVGKVLSVVMPVVGLTLFPVFTVYITNGILKMTNRSPQTNTGQTDTASSTDVSSTPAS